MTFTKNFLYLLLLASCSVSHAALISYDLRVEVTDTPLVPGSFSTNPWDFSSSLVFNGTFTADDTVSGEISNLNIGIGGGSIIDTATFINTFNPFTLVLTFGFLEPDFGVVFGNFSGSGAPENYVVSTENSTAGPITDPYYSGTQNWVGTYTITTSSNVPEPATIALLGLGLVGLGVSKKRKPLKI